MITCACFRPEWQSEIPRPLFNEEKAAKGIHFPSFKIRNRCKGILGSRFSVNNPFFSVPMQGYMSSSKRFQPTLPVRGATASTNKFETLILYHKYNFGIIS